MTDPSTFSAPPQPSPWLHLQLWAVGQQSFCALPSSLLVSPLHFNGVPPSPQQGESAHKMEEKTGTRRFPSLFRRKEKTKQTFIHGWVFQVQQHQGIQHPFFILSVSGNGSPNLRQQNYIPIYCQASTSQIAPTVLLRERKNFSHFEGTRERKAAAKSDRSSNCFFLFFPFFFLNFTRKFWKFRFCQG